MKRRTADRLRDGGFSRSELLLIEKSGQVLVRTMSSNSANCLKILGVCQEF